MPEDDLEKFRNFHCKKWRLSLKGKIFKGRLHLKCGKNFLSMPLSKPILFLALAGGSAVASYGCYRFFYAFVGKKQSNGSGGVAAEETGSGGESAEASGASSQSEKVVAQGVSTQEPSSREAGGGATTTGGDSSKSTPRGASTEGSSTPSGN